MKIRLGEKPFLSVSGEGNRTGQLTIFVRFFGCNLECGGFGQKDPTDKSSYILPYQTIDISSITKMEDLPVFEYGCDSSYSWSAKYKHLALDYTEETLASAILDLLPDQKWVNAKTGNVYDLCFTGGEPMMNQLAMIAVLKQIQAKVSHLPKVIQIETNGTKPISDKFKDFIWALNTYETGINFNISPKLFNVSGELPSKAWKPEIIQSYMDIACGYGVLKFVVNEKEETWAELEKNISDIEWLSFPIYIMPVGALKEQQEDSVVVSKIANKAIQRGFNISGRLHCTLFGNTIGT